MGGGESLIDWGDGKSDGALHLVDKVPYLLGGGSIGAVHIAGQADHNTYNLMVMNEFRNGFGNLFRGLIVQEREGGGKRSGRIGEGKADADGSVVDPQDTAHAE